MSKTALQEWAHANHQITPKYRELSRTGPDHDPEFVVEVVLANLASETGSGRSKRSAEQEAAKNVLVREGVWKR